LIVNVVDALPPPDEAVIVDAVLVTTGVVVMVNDVDDAPAGTTTGAPITASLALLVTVIVVSAAVAPVKVTVPVDDVPPATALGERWIEETAGTLIRRWQVCDTPAFAVIVTSGEIDTGTVWTVAIADVEPAGTFTDPVVNVAAELLLVSVTTVPVEGAGPFKVTVTVALAPPVTACGATVTDAS